MDKQKLKDELGFQYGINKHVSPHTTFTKNNSTTQIVIASEPPIAATRITHGSHSWQTPHQPQFSKKGKIEV
nr:hypothetical protein [Candidatus Bathyarchaeota archaeon]